jgi:hypothetical protein
MMQRWVKTNGSLQESICAENNFDDLHENLYPPSINDEPDF